MGIWDQVSTGLNNLVQNNKSMINNLVPNAPDRSNWNPGVNSSVGYEQYPKALAAQQGQIPWEQNMGTAFTPDTPEQRYANAVAAKAGEIPWDPSMGTAFKPASMATDPWEGVSDAHTWHFAPEDHPRSRLYALDHGTATGNPQNTTGTGGTGTVGEYTGQTATSTVPAGPGGTAPGGTAPGGATTGGTSPGGNTITMPGMSNNSVPGWIDDLAAGIPNYFDAYNQATQLPGMIDEWSQNLINSQRATGEQVAGIFNNVANQRADTGIRGGTNQENVLANMMTQLARMHGDNKTNIGLQANNMKANAISNLPGQAMMAVNAMNSLYGANAADQQNWAALAANILNTGY